jgi:hypothetical protein
MQDNAKCAMNEELVRDKTEISTVQNITQYDTAMTPVLIRGH